MSATDTPRRSRKAVTAAAQQRYGARVRAVYSLATEYVATELLAADRRGEARCKCGECWPCRFRAYLDPVSVRRRVDGLAELGDDDEGGVE